MNRVDELEKENKLLREQIAQIRVKNSLLQEHLNLLLNRQFTASSEKVSSDQLGLFNEAEELEHEDDINASNETVTVNSHERKAKPRVSISPDLPREEVVHDLAESEKICP